MCLFLFVNPTLNIYSTGQETLIKDLDRQKDVPVSYLQHGPWGRVPEAMHGLCTEFYYDIMLMLSCVDHCFLTIGFWQFRDKNGILFRDVDHTAVRRICAGGFGISVFFHVHRCFIIKVYPTNVFYYVFGRDVIFMNWGTSEQNVVLSEIWGKQLTNPVVLK